MSDEWISASEARSLAFVSYPKAADAELCILRIAKDGKVRALADEFRIGSPARLPLANGAEVPLHFWGAMIEAVCSGRWIDESPANRWLDWPAGCFAFSIAGQAYEATNVRFQREELVTALQQFAMSVEAQPTPFTNPEIDQFINATPLGGMKKARNYFMRSPRAKGLSATFEVRWNLIKQRQPGRPRKTAS